MIVRVPAPFLLLAGLATAAPLVAQGAPLAVARAAARAVVADSVAGARAALLADAAAHPAAPAPRLGLAVLARATYAHAAAREWLDSAARVAAADARWRGAVAREGSLAATLRGDHVLAFDLAQRALADTLAMPADERAWTRFQQVTARRRRGVRVTAATLDSLTAAAGARDSLLHGRLACIRTAFEPRRAEALADSGTALLEGAGDLQGAGTCLVQLGAWRTERGEPSRAWRAFLRADSLFVRAHDPAGRAAANQRAGYVLLTVGNVQEARERLAIALREAARADDPVVLAWATMNVAQSLDVAGERARAVATMERAMALHRQTGDLLGVATAEGFVADARLAIGDVATADSLYRALRAVARGRGDATGALRAMNGLADVAVRRGDFARGAALLDSLDAGADAMPGLRTYSLPMLRGRLALRRGDFAAAQRWLAAARDSLAPRQVLYRHETSLALAWAALRTGDTATAVATLVRADSTIGAWRDELTAVALRASLAGRRTDWGGTGDEGDRLLAALAPTRHLPLVFRVAERQRARALVDVVVAGGDSVAIGAVRAGAAGQLDLAAAQAALPADAALVVYAGGAGDAPLLAMVVTRGRARGIPLATRATVDPLVARWDALLEAGDAGRGAGTALARAVLAPVLAALPRGVTRLAIVPQGALHRVPWGALPIGAGVVADRWATWTAPSAALALRGLRDGVPVPGRVLAIGAGEPAQPDAAPGALAERGAPLAALPAAADEARAATAWAPGSRALTDEGATEAALARAAREGDWTILHAAAHALTTDQALGASWLIVRGDGDADGYVSGSELAALARGRTLVVLSGCRTTGDFGARGDAVDGLVAPLLAGGVRTVIASHWAVSDASTKELMTRFYGALAAGRPVGAALADAQRAMRRAGASPRAWAAFTVIGDPSVRFIAPARPGAVRAGS